MEWKDGAELGDLSKPAKEGDFACAIGTSHRLHQPPDNKVYLRGQESQMRVPTEMRYLQSE